MAESGLYQRFHQLSEIFFEQGDESQLVEMFAILDKDRNGQIDAAELKIIVGEGMSDKRAQENAEEFIQASDTNKNGVIEFSEFSEFFNNMRKP